jgi:2-dehydropantoate 2-reductase
VNHPRELSIGSDDVVILTMKTQHTLGALEDLREAAGDQVPVVCCQNGVANERMALRCFQNVYAMLVHLPAQMTRPGLIQTHMATKSGVLDLCRFPEATDERCSEIARRLASANFSSRPNLEVMRFKYEKLLMNLRNGLGAICGNGSEQDAVYQQMRREGEASYTAAGIDWASEDEVKELRKDTIVRGKIEGVEEVGNSTFQSLLRQTGDAESDFLNGEICLLGRLHGVPTPANRVVQRLSNELARRRGRPQSIPIQEIERLISQAAQDPAHL